MYSSIHQEELREIIETLSTSNLHVQTDYGRTDLFG